MGELVEIMWEICDDVLNSLATERETLMTVVVAMVENDTSILLASDGMVLEGGALKDRRHKLNRHPSAPLAWGLCGNVAIDDDFTTWLQKYEWPPPSRDTLRSDMIERLSMLNGRQRELTKMARAEAKDEHLGSALVVGFLGGPEIWELYNDGRATSYLRYGFHAIGSGGDFAYVSYLTLELDMVSGISKLDKLEAIMKIVVNHEKKCGPPIDIWRITPDGVTIVIEGDDAKDRAMSS